MGRCGSRVSLTTGTTLWVSFVVLLTSLVVFGLWYDAYQRGQVLYIQQLSTSFQYGSASAVDRLVDNLNEAARAVRQSEPSIDTCSMPRSGFNPERLIRLITALSTDDTRQLSSVGIIMQAPNTTNGKSSWQVAKGYGCPVYMYAYAEPASYPNFTGYCVSDDANVPFTPTTVPPTYQGVDWGLTSEEYNLVVLKQGAQIYKPIFALIDYLTLSTEVAVLCQNSSYGAVFAEQKLSQLSDALNFVTNATKTPGDENVLFIMERSSGQLVAASVPAQTQRPDPNSAFGALRVTATAASDARIRAIAQATRTCGSTVTTDDWWIVTSQYQTGNVSAQVGLDWCIVSAVPYHSFTKALRDISGMALGTGFAIIFVMVLAGAVGSYWYVTRRIKFYTGKRVGGDDDTDQEPLLEFAEVAQIRHALKNRAAEPEL
jgi:hypothetical protein